MCDDLSPALHSLSWHRMPKKRPLQHRTASFANARARSESRKNARGSTVPGELGEVIPPSMLGKRPRPAFICTRCGYYGYTPALIGAACGRTISGRSCQGQNRDALDPSYWKDCSGCRATGLRSGVICSSCDGYGWCFADATSL